ncbi:fibronectin type III [Paraoerskovia sediminicola]|uniref:Fibronectin type III n=1 Tax=Paraoerskovia sediminicola TaxID=1138587 RepID=A0ABM8G053_9CELL|nr:Ig-like domain-containing protein [Paraoerskovia sediminicola]BDZ41265.1 fibronectin type III [Paraoerskovia sediminicola]
MTTVALFATAMVAMAVTADGEPTADVDVNDSGVWVTRTSSGEVGRFNSAAQAIDGTLLASSGSFDVIQHAGDVLLDDDGTSVVNGIDIARLTLQGAAKLPPDADVDMQAGTVAILDGEEGLLWVLPLDRLASFDSEETEATLDVGGAGAVAVGTDGVAHAVVPGKGIISVGLVEGADEEEGLVAGEPDTRAVDGLSVGDDVEIATLGHEVVVLDRSTSTLVLPDGDRAELPDVGPTARLQQSGGPADVVAVATPSALITQPVGGGDPTTRPFSGTPAAPVQVSGCLYGAWAGSGQVLRDCAGTDADLERTVDGTDESSPLVYRVNREVVVLNDLAAGTLWVPAEDFMIVEEWDQKVPEDVATGEPSDADDAAPEVVDQLVLDRARKNRDPQAKDDAFGVRPGRTTTLPVLANDIDPDGDVMTAAVDGDAPEGVAVEPVLDGGALQAVVPDDATGSSTFAYEVVDGRGGEDTADVALTVSPWDENGSPEQSGEPVLVVARGTSAEIDVLPYFLDPDGDHLYLAGAAATTPGDTVRFHADGTVEFTDGGSSTGRKEVTVAVADGLGGAVEGTLWIDVQGGQDIPPIAVGDHVVARVDEEVTVTPLENDTDPDGDELRLAKVTDAEPAVIVPAYETASFRFTAPEVGSYDIAYQVTDGTSSTTGVVRVDVIDPAENKGAPIAVSDSVLLPAGGTGLVDVLANDSDPAGGTLVVQSVELPEESDVTVALLEHRILRFAEVRRLAEPVTVEYTVSNGSETATGQVEVFPVPEPERLQPPVAVEDEALVHTGDVVTVPVLANDTHPDGLALTLGDELDGDVDPALGEVFVSGDVVRFRAGSEAGTAHAIYRVSDENGQEDSAQITVRVVDEEENAAPQPPDVEVRTLSGSSLRVPVPLDGVDPDGDSVRLTGIAQAPGKGIARVVDGKIEYQAVAGVSGSDTFRYTVTDSRGMDGTGLVRVGIAPEPTTNHPPVAVDDLVHLRPGRTVSIDALRNDSDPDSDPIALVPGALDGGEDLGAKVVDNRVVVETPEEPGPVSFYYTIEDRLGARASAAITIDVDGEAPLEPPVAVDDVVTPDQVIGRTSIEVPVLDNDVDPDGVAEALTVTTDQDDVVVAEDGTVTVPLAAERRVVTYTVTDQDELTDRAFVLVPGVDNVSPDSEDAQQDPDGPERAAPVVNPSSPLEVRTGETLTIDVRDHVTVADGRSARITVASSVSAVAGSATVGSPTAISYVSDEGYAGPAAVSFEITDGTGPDDPEGKTLLVTVPITVLPPENVPPEPGTPTLEVAAGESASLDLALSASDANDDPLTFTLTGPPPEGYSVSIDGSRIAVELDPEVRKGTSASLGYTVSDGDAAPVDGVLTTTVVGSRKPLAVANPDTVDDAFQGRETSVPVLENDTNPFPGTDLEIVGAAVETGRGDAVIDGDSIKVTPTEDFVGVIVVRYEIQDATLDPDRVVEGRIKVTVLGRPEVPAAPQVVEVRSKTVVLSWDPPIDNGSDITGYTVRSDQGDTRECETTTCTIDGLTNDVEYTFTVTATNDVGTSDVSEASEVARPDEKPDQPSAPTLEFVPGVPPTGGALTVRWTNATYTDRSPIESVNLRISPAPPSGNDTKTGVTGNQVVWTGLSNGTSYTVSVQAVNRAPEPSDWSAASRGEKPAGIPGAPGAPTATRVDDALGGQVALTWAAPKENGAPITSSAIQVRAGGSVEKTVPVSGAATSATVTGLNVSSTYTFTVVATNKAGKSPSSGASNAVIPYGKPGVPGTPTAKLASNTDGRAVVTFGAAKANGNAVTYTVRANDSGAGNTTTSTSYTYTGLTNGSSYSFDVRACNAAGCSAWSAQSGSVKPYGVPSTPSAPTFNRTGSGWPTPYGGNFTMSGPSTWNGQSGRVERQLNGSGISNGTGRVNVNAAWGATNTLRIRACNDAGCSSWASRSASLPDKPARSVTMRKGGGAGADGYPNSNYFHLTVRYGEPNTTFQTKCFGDKGAGMFEFGYSGGGWFNTANDGRTFRTDANGYWDGDLQCFWGWFNSTTKIRTSTFGDTPNFAWS